MNHDDVKRQLLCHPGIKREYEALESLYEIKSQLIELRNQMGISQKELAEMVGTKQSAISRLESGTYNPSIEFLGRVAHALGGRLEISIVRDQDVT